MLRSPLPCLAGLAALLAACGPPPRPGQPPRHVLLITVDTLRADHLSCYLYPRATSVTPSSPEERAAGGGWSIDRLAEKGVLFAEAFAPRGETFPSIATLMTGQGPFHHGAFDNLNRLEEQHETLAERFAASGFATGAFTTNRLLGPAIDPSGRTRVPSGIEQGFAEFQHLWNEADRDLAAVGAAATWSKARRAEGDPPQFLWLHLMGPHLPYDPAPLHGRDFGRLFADPSYSGPADGSREFLDPIYAAGRGLEPLDVARVVALYDGEIARINYLLSLFWLTLFGGEGGAAAERDTLVIFAADHGEELYQRHGYWGHSKSVYSSVLHVPLLISHPASLTGSRVIGEVVELADLAPTLCDWFALPALSGSTGRSLLPLVDSYVRRPFERRPAFGQWSDRIFSVTDGDWRLVYNPERLTPDDPPAGPYPIPPLALFDRRRDPLELADVSAREPETVARLLRELEAWLERVPEGSPRSTAVDGALAESLRAMGYLDTPRAEPPEPARTEPAEAPSAEPAQPLRAEPAEAPPAEPESGDAPGPEAGGGQE